MTTQQAFLSQFFLKIKGTLAPKELMNDLIEITVEDNLHLPDMFAIHLHDHGMRWTNSGLLDVGNPVEVTAQAFDPRSKQLGPRTLLIQGEITGLEPELGETGVPSLVVRGYDRSYRLHQGRRTRSFLQSTDSEIAQKIAAEVGLKDEVQPTSTIHDHIAQTNQTDMEFLLERARRLGYHFYVEGDTLYFGSHRPEGQAAELAWGLNLVSFRPVLTAVHQVEEVVVRGWDPMTKREIVGRATQSDTMPQVKGRDKAQAGFKGSNQVVVSRPVQSQAEADALAQAMRDEMAGEMLQAEGVCLGNPQVKAGYLVKIAGLGEQFDGEYFVTEAIHAYHAEEGYETSFSIGGKKAETLGLLLGGESKGANGLGRGVVVGVVTNNKDPEGLGRVKVKYPGLDDKDESPWVRMVTPMAGEKRGIYCLPEINDEVLVAFEQGDIHRPYMLGMLWNGPDKPPKANNEVVGGDGRVNQRLIRSRSGHEIILDDTAGREQVIISDRSGNQIIMAQNSVSLKVKGNLTIEASGKITMKGASVDINM